MSNCHKRHLTDFFETFRNYKTLLVTFRANVLNDDECHPGHLGDQKSGPLIISMVVPLVGFFDPSNHSLCAQMKMIAAIITEQRGNGKSATTQE